MRTEKNMRISEHTVSKTYYTKGRYTHMAKKVYPYSNERVEGFGNLSRKPRKISGANAKTTVVVISVATNSQGVDRDGEAVKRANFHEVKLFGRDAELAYMNLDKGDRIHFAGDVFPTEYTNRDGELVESSEVNADRGSVYLAPLWEEMDTRNFDDYEQDDDEDETPSRSRKSARKSSKRNLARRRAKQEPQEDVEDWDDEELLDDEDLDDDFEEDAAPRRPQRRSKRKARKSDVDVDEDLDDYEELL